VCTKFAIYVFITFIKYDHSQKIGKPNVLKEFRDKKKIGEEFDDTKGVIKIRKSEQDRRYDGQKEKIQKDKQRSTKHTHKTKDRVTRTPLKDLNRISTQDPYA